MYKFLVLLSVIGCALGVALPEGLARQPTGRIAGGSPTNIKNYPYTVSVQRHGAHACSGAVYSYNLILTAAHCMQEVTPEELTTVRVRAGSSLWNSGGTFCNVDRFLNHENYNPNTMENDITILRLINYISVETYQRPIKLSLITPNANVNAVVTGWGSQNTNGPLQRELLYADVTTITTSLCSSNARGTGKQIKDSMICAIGEGKDLWQANSGGPLVVDDKLVGIASWGLGSGNEYTGVYTNAVLQRGWILQSINNNLRPSDFNRRITF